MCASQTASMHKIGNPKTIERKISFQTQGRQKNSMAVEKFLADLGEKLQWKV